MYPYWWLSHDYDHHRNLFYINAAWLGTAVAVDLYRRWQNRNTYVASSGELASGAKDWQAPSELLGRVPRRVELSFGRLASTFLTPAFAGTIAYFGSWSVVFRAAFIDANTRGTIDDIAAIATAIFTYYWIDRKRALVKWGAVAPAVVCETTSEDDLLGAPYQFTGPGGVTVWGRSKLDSAAMANDVITIVYDPHRPKRCCAYPVDGINVVEPEEKAASANA